jgi:hypothetical protein
MKEDTFFRQLVRNIACTAMIGAQRGPIECATLVCDQSISVDCSKYKLESLILAQNERWRRA